jgi:hypothetical protein
MNYLIFRTLDAALNAGHIPLPSYVKSLGGIEEFTETDHHQPEQMWRRTVEVDPSVVKTAGIETYKKIMEHFKASSLHHNPHN